MNEGSGILEKVAKTYPNLKIVPVVSEKDAFDMVENNQVNLTLRSMILSAYTIRKEAYLNLESVGFANDNFTNRLNSSRGISWYEYKVVANPSFSFSTIHSNGWMSMHVQTSPIDCGLFAMSGLGNSINL